MKIKVNDPGARETLRYLLQTGGISIEDDPTNTVGLLDDDARDEIDRHVDAGNHLYAIKALREATPGTYRLREARDVIEAYAAARP